MPRSRYVQWSIKISAHVLFFAYALSCFGEKPQVSLSLPQSDMLVRAIVPVFGRVYTTTPSDPLRVWYVEFGPGRNPTDWTRIKESQKAEPIDPFLAGRAKWDPNTGANGNLANWNVGLQGYRYATWRNNLNGIYTLRLVAQSQSGDIAETRASVFVGEAIVRTQGGTAISADGGCRVAVPAFSFDGIDSRVIAVIKQVPSSPVSIPISAGPTDEIGGPANAIYASASLGHTPLSAIYRIYPNGVEVDPALSIEIDTQAAFNASEREAAAIHQWNPVVQRWTPLPTEWAGTTAIAKLNQISPYESYVGVLRRTTAATHTYAEWRPLTPLTGRWTGFTDPMSIVRVREGGRVQGETRADANGVFSLPHVRAASAGIYTIETALTEAGAPTGHVQVRLDAAPVVMTRAPRLSAPLSTEISDNTETYIICEDDTVIDTSVSAARSILVQAHNSSFSKNFLLELSESVSGSGRFLVELRLNDEDSPYYPVFQSLRAGEVITLNAGASSLHLTVKRNAPPQITLSSPTHPSLFYAAGNSPWPPALVSTRNHSMASVDWTQQGWALSGIPGKLSARVVHWMASPINVDSWPLIGFSYRAVDAQNWQLLLRAENSIYTLNLGKANSWFRDFSKTTPLVNKNEWLRWQQNLTGGPLKTISQVSFGSWVKGAYLEARPGFSDAHSETLWVKDLWIGKTYNEASVQMDWSIKETAPLRSIDWWVNRDAESSEPSPQDIQARIDLRPKSVDSCRFTVPESGTWYFHLRATDTSGYSNPPTAFPLSIVFNHASSLLRHLGTGPQEVEWNQPDGAFKIHLGDLAPTLSIKTLRLIVGEKSYPISKGVIDYGTATLDISANSFDETVPLGINGESITVSLNASDLNGKPIENIAQARLRIRSPFREEQTPAGLVIKVADKELDGGLPWFTYWKLPQPPWMEDFPGSVNNSLVFFRGVNSRKDQTPIRWERPISIIASSEQKQTWIESIESVWTKAQSEAEARNLPVIDRRGGEIRSSSLGTQWAEIITPESIFEPGYVRVAIATRGSGTRIIRTKVSDALRLLSRQTEKQTFRLDGWIPPAGQPTVITLPSDASIDYAVQGMTTLNRLTSDAFQIEPSGEWQRFAFVIHPPKTATRTQRVNMKGTSYW